MSEQINTEVTEVTEVVAQPEATNEIEIEYLGNKEKISLDDKEALKVLLQKGKNADRITEKWEATKPTLSKTEEIARLWGFKDENGKGNIDEFLDTVKSNYEKQQVQEMVDSGLTEDYAKELIEKRTNEEKLKAELEAYREIDRKNKAQLEFLEFFKEVNGRKFDDNIDILPPEIFREEKNGKSLKLAYAEYLLKQRKQVEAVEKVNSENKETSAPSLSTTGKEKTSFTEEEVRGMSRTDVAKNLNVITESMKKWKK